MKDGFWRLSLTVCLVGILGGCAFSTTQLKLDYTAPHYSKITEASARIEVRPLKDIRGVDPNLIAQKQNQYGKTTGKYVSEKELSVILTEALRKLLSDLNYKVADGSGEIILTGEIIKFEQNILMGFWTGKLEGNVQVNLRLLAAKSNNILWNEIISGHTIKSGITHGTDDIRIEVAKMTFDNLMTNIANSPTFKAVIEKNSSP
jgi:hypothetical protein